PALSRFSSVRTTPPHESKRLDPTKPHPDRTRTWVDRTGQFKVEAEFLGLENDNIRLHKVNGAIITVPTAKMSPKDLAYVSAEVNKTPTTAQGNYGVPYPVMSKQSDSPILPKVQHLTLQPQPKKPSIDWFEFFLDVGCDLDDCTRYAATFDHDRIKEASLGDITAPQLRSLGLREGDVSRVMRAIGERGRGLGAIAKEQMGKGMTPSPWRSQSPSQLSQSQSQNLQINLFKLFLDAGCGPADSIDYAALFPQEQVDEATLESFTESTLRSLGLREDDILRVLKAIEKRGLHRRDGSARKERIREETDDSWALSPQSNLQITSPTSTAKNQPLALQAPPDSPAPRRAPTVAPITTPTTTSNTQRLTTITTAEASQLTPSDFNTLIKTNHRESQR
ncbi:cytoskeletal protein binding protein, partial [Ceratobasidium sp. 395]